MNETDTYYLYKSKEIAQNFGIDTFYQHHIYEQYNVDKKYWNFSKMMYFFLYLEIL